MKERSLYMGYLLKKSMVHLCLLNPVSNNIFIKKITIKGKKYTHYNKYFHINI